MELAGKHALVTGGGTGIGFAIAAALAQAGAQVTVTGRRGGLLDKIAKAYDPMHALHMDVTDEASVRDGIAAAADARGPITHCIANAGIAEGGPFNAITLADWQRMMRTNLDGAFLTFQAAMATLPAGTPGRMIGISSIAGVKGLKRAVPYTVSKHGLVGLIRGLSEEYLGGPVTFNAICPGYVETPIVTRQIPDVMRRKKISELEARKVFAQGNRHARLLQVEEIAAAALWLCSDAARSVNGQTIEIVGGQV